MLLYQKIRRTKKFGVNEELKGYSLGKRLITNLANFLFILHYNLNVNPSFPPEKALPPPNSRLSPTLSEK